MSTSASKEKMESPQLGEGVYFADDVAKILALPYHRVYYLMKTFWRSYTFGGDRNKAINFYGLIEFYTYYHLREKGFSGRHIKQFHDELSQSLKTDYPFASIRVSDRKRDSKKSRIWYEYLGEFMRDDRITQPSINSFIKPFMKHIEYGNDQIAKRLFPLGKSKKIVVDPEHQFGQPVITGTNLQTQTVYRLYQAGESKTNIKKLYDISEKEIDEAIRFHKVKAA